MPYQPTDNAAVVPRLRDQTSSPIWALPYACEPGEDHQLPGLPHWRSRGDLLSSAASPSPPLQLCGR